MNINSKQIRAVNAATPTLIEVEENERIADKQHLSARDIAQEFEELYKNQKLDFTREEEKTHKIFKSENTELIYRAFRLAFEEQRKAIRRALSKAKIGVPTHPFIVGMQVKDNTVQFGFRPFKHSSFARALEEAAKLSDKHGKQYTVFGALQSTGPREHTPVAETKQQEKGKLVRSPFKVMHELQGIYAAKNSEPFNMPCEIAMCTDSNPRFKIRFTYSEDIYFDSYAECIEFIDNWIKMFKNNECL